MAFKLFEDTWETSTTTGTGTYTLAGAVTSWRAFSAQYSNGDTCWYSAFDGANFEHGLGTYSSGTLARTTIYHSSNGGSAVSWSAGTRQIVVAPLGVTVESLLVPGSSGYPKRTADNTWAYKTAPQIALEFTTPTRQTFTTGSGTYTTPAGVLFIEVEIWGPGGGGGGSGTSGGTGTTGTDTTFGSLTAHGGTGGASNGSPGGGGSASGGDDNISGNNGQFGANAVSSFGAPGGAAPFFGLFGGNTTTTGQAAPGQCGGGGGGAGSGAAAGSGGGGGGGAYCFKVIATPSATYSYVVGAAGSGGTAGTSGFVGGNGSTGFIRVREFYA